LYWLFEILFLWYQGKAQLPMASIGSYVAESDLCGSKMTELVYYDLKESTGLTHSLSTQIARELGRRIVAKNYAPGDLVEDENALATKYQVSRSVVRDAVKILVGKGLLEVRRGIGTRVRPREQWGLLDDDVLAWHQSAPVSRDFLNQLLDVRRIIEPAAARWAAERADDETRQIILDATERMEQETGSIEDFVMADALFHRAILRASSNEILRSMEGVIFSALLSSIRLTNRDPRDNERSIPFHRNVANAIMERNGDLAEACMSEHLEDAHRQLNERL
jgi:DNA-binding FadR family transcriptional regulator